MAPFAEYLVVVLSFSFSETRLRKSIFPLEDEDEAAPAGLADEARMLSKAKACDIAMAYLTAEHLTVTRPLRYTLAAKVF